MYYLSLCACGAALVSAIGAVPDAKAGKVLASTDSVAMLQEAFALVTPTAPRDAGAATKMPLHGSKLMQQFQRAGRRFRGASTAKSQSFPCGLDNLSLLLCGSIAAIVTVMGASIAYLNFTGRPSKGKDLDGPFAQARGEDASHVDLLPGVPLCPSLVVPDNRRLACIVQAVAGRQKQDTIFDVVSAREAQVPLFRIKIAELRDDSPAIYIETLGGKETLACLSTKELWSGASDNPVLAIHRPWGAQYATIQKNDAGDYIVYAGRHGQRSGPPLLVLSGDIRTHSVKVSNASNRVVGQTEEASPGSYQVTVWARVDVGLVLLGLLAMAKCENRAPASGS